MRHYIVAVPLVVFALMLASGILELTEATVAIFCVVEAAACIHYARHIRNRLHYSQPKYDRRSHPR